MTQQTATQRELNIQTIEHKGLKWVNIEQPSSAEMEFLRQNYPFHPLDLDDCVSRVQLPKLDEYEDYIFLVLHFPIFNEKSRVTVPSQVSIFVGANYLVTVHQGNLRPFTKSFTDCLQSEEVRERFMGHGSGRLLYRILDGLVDYCFPILTAIIRKVDAVEERVFEDSARETVRELSMLRRDLISYRRIIRPQIDVLELLEEKEFPFLKVNPDVYFGDLADHTRRIWVELEELKEVLDSLSDSHASLTSHHTNEVMRVLTIIATIMLPLSVLSGLYGMNVRLPLESSRLAFVFVLLMMLGIAGGMLLFFRFRRWI
ncbi:MAG: magnesium transporter CorA family protein [Chloroflexi bacterium]|nr:magnesium transporter CorA family protein [Chloroflexota bacterium]